MTVVAVGRGTNRNVLVVDWVKGVLQPDGAYDFETVRCDKMLRVGDAYITTVGDDQALVAAYTLGVWAEGRCPDFTQNGPFKALVDFVDRLWIIHREKLPHVRRKGFTLVLCAADAVYYRTVHVDGYKVVGIDAGKEVGESMLEVIYGGKPFWCGYDETEEGLIDRAVAAMKRTDEEVRNDPRACGCEPLPYPFPSGWSSVVIPTDGSAPRRERPFASPVEESAWEGGLANLAADGEFTSFPHPRKLPLRP